MGIYAVAVAFFQRHLHVVKAFHQLTVLVFVEGKL